MPDKEPDRGLRAERINRLFEQLNSLWPDIDILVIAQNWKNFKPVETNNKQIIKEYPALGILGARKILRKEFLTLKYDYIIMFDDDAIIECDDDHAHLDFIKEVEKHPQGFCFIHGHNSKYHPYTAAQLNLCAISRFIYLHEDMVPIDPQKKEGFEDSIFACLLHHKWGKYEFDPPTTIRHIQFNNTNEKAPSTWSREAQKTGGLLYVITNTNRIQEYIAKYKKFPEKYRQMLIVQIKNKKESIGTKKPNTPWYF